MGGSARRTAPFGADNERELAAVADAPDQVLCIAAPLAWARG
jgi:hypothetical protein